MQTIIRPGPVRHRTISLIPDSTAVLINPSLMELVKAMAVLEKWARKNIMPQHRLAELLEASKQQGFFSRIVMTAVKAPDAYNYEFASSQAAACSIADGVTGFVLRRAKTQPGDYVEKPLYDLQPQDEAFNPSAWVESVCVTFWTKLTEEQLVQVQHRSIQYAFLVSNRRHWRELREGREAHLRKLTRKRMPAEQLAKMRATLDAKARAQAEENRRMKAEEEETARRMEEEREKRTALILESLFNGVRPGDSTVLQEGCADIAGVLEKRNENDISWKEIKTQWPSLVARHEELFLPHICDGRITRESLGSISDRAAFDMSLTLWEDCRESVVVPQIVFQVNGETFFKSLAHQDEDAMKAINEAIIANVQGWHPTADWTVGWLRVSVDYGNAIAFVDEVQSDAMEMIRRQKVRGLKPEAIARILRWLTPWNLHGYACVRRWAREVGLGVGMHSRESAASREGMTQSERKWNEYYQPIIKAFRMESRTVDGYSAPIMIDPSLA